MKTHSIRTFLPLTVVGFATISTASAATSAIYDSFATLPASQGVPGFTVGGTPSVPAAISTNSIITLALKAQQRYNNPVLTNDGAGTYFATTGQNNGLGGSSHQGATWNFSFYIDPGTSSLLDYSYTLFYGLDGGTVHSFDPIADADAVAQFNSTGAYQDSQNLLFSTFGGAPNGFTSFDPNAAGVYHFELRATNNVTQATTSSAINVQVNSVPDSGSTLIFLGLALGGVSAARRKFRN